jgi:hypothetical protein
MIRQQASSAFLSPSTSKREIPSPIDMVSTSPLLVGSFPYLLRSLEHSEVGIWDPLSLNYIFLHNHSIKQDDF